MTGNKKRLVFLVTAIITVTSALLIALPDTKAAESITILIDGQIFYPPDALPFISSDRVMVPFRPIGEALGSTANWDNAQQKVTMSLGNRSLDFIIGSTAMNLTSVDTNGSIVRTTVTLDVPAMLVNNNRAFVPIRALSEGLGATVDWSAESRTVIITSNRPRATPTPVYTPVPAINPAFATSGNFEIISGTRAQDIYNGNIKEVLLYFDSSDADAVNKMQAIMQAARLVNAKVYGVDIRTSPNLANLNWIYNYVNRNSRGPALIFYYSRDNVLPYIAFANQNEINSYFENWSKNVYSIVTPTFTPTPRPTGTITPTPPPELKFSGKFREVSKFDAMYMHEYGERFILLYFDSKKTNFSESRLRNAIEAVQEADKVVYYMDDYHEGDYDWFGTDHYSNDNMPNPCMFFIEYENIEHVETRFSNPESLTEDIKWFLR